MYLELSLISWSSKKQSLVAHSSTKADYWALAHTIIELLWIEYRLIKLHVKYQIPTLLYDNINVVMIPHNLVLHARTKHIAFDNQFVREIVSTDKLMI